MVYLYSGHVFWVAFLYNVAGKVRLEQCLIIFFFPEDLPDNVVPALREVHLSAFFRINKEK